MGQKEMSIDQYVAWLQEGKSFAYIRADMYAQGYSEEQIKLLISRINQKAIHLEQKKVKESPGFPAQFWIGIIAMGVGLYFLISEEEWDGLELIFVGIVVWVSGLIKYYKQNQKER